MRFKAHARHGPGVTAAGAGDGPWFVYLLECGDGTLYCGVTNRLEARLLAHAQGRGARYTRGRGPLRLAYLEPAPDRGAALRREHALKELPRAHKLALAGGMPAVPLAAALASVGAGAAGAPP